MFTNWPNTAWKIQMSLAWMSYYSKFKKTKDFFFKLFFFHCRMHFPPFVKVHTAALLPISGIMLNEILHWNPSKFATFYVYKISKLIFPFFPSCYTLYFLQVNILVLVEIQQGIHYLMGKNIVVQKVNSNFGFFFV